MSKLTTQQYTAARRMIDEEVIGAFDQHKGKILDSWYDKLAEVLQFTEPEVFGSTMGTIPTDDEMKGKYIGVTGVVPHPVKEVINNGHCPQCGADVTQPQIPYAHKSVAGNIMPGHTDITEQIKDLLWHDDEYEFKDKQINERLFEAYRRGKDSK